MRRGTAGLALVAALLSGGLAACADDGPGAAPAPTPSDQGRTAASRTPTGPGRSEPAAPPVDDTLERAGVLAAAAEAEAALLLAEAASEAGPPLPRGTLGADASWPQCPPGMGIPERPTLGKPMPVADARFVVLGLTNGPGFTRNPCLADQVAWARERRLPVAAYAVASWPGDLLDEHAHDGPYDGETRLGALRNAGYQQARHNLATMADAGLASPVVWIDVEPVPDFEWSGDLAANAAVVQGLARGYHDAGPATGVSSTPHLWAQAVGDLRLGVPEWRAAGQTSRAEAVSRCSTDWTIQGGAAVMTQWVQDERDHDVTCLRLRAGNWFDLP